MTDQEKIYEEVDKIRAEQTKTIRRDSGKPELQVGDRVRVGGHEVLTGTIIEVTYKVEMDHAAALDFASLPADQLELIRGT
jgi:hypothetical protein